MVGKPPSPRHRSGLMWTRSLNLRNWARECRIYEPVRTDLFHVIRPGQRENLEAFGKVCHHLITDRDISFDLKARIDLYRRWASSGQPCLLSTHDGARQIVAATVILSLTDSAYRRFWFDGTLDAIEIGQADLAQPRAPARHRFFLVDIVARNKALINMLSKQERFDFLGIGFRAALYHISLFFEPNQPVIPVVLCSTLHPDLGPLLELAGFERSVGQGNMAAPIFRADYGQSKRLTSDAHWFFDEAVAVIRGYASDTAARNGVKAGSVRR